MPRSPRAAARTRVTKDLAKAKRSIAIMQGWWKTTSTVYVPDPDDSNKRGEWRDRVPGEYPEDHAQYWELTIRRIDGLMVMLGALREHALTEYHLTERKDQP